MPFSLWDLRFPDQGLNPGPQHQELNPNHWTTREAPTADLLVG